jgi:hypothetical protein
MDKLAIKIHQELQDHKLRGKVMKLKEAESKWKNKEASDFLAPPPTSLLEARPLISVTKPLGAHQPNNEPMLVSTGKIHRNLQSDAINVDEDDDVKENVCPASVKKHLTTIAGMDLFSMSTWVIKMWILPQAPSQLRCNNAPNSLS